MDFAPAFIDQRSRADDAQSGLLLAQLVDALLGNAATQGGECVANHNPKALFVFSPMPCGYSPNLALKALASFSVVGSTWMASRIL